MSLLIALEGGDGTGKSTQVRALCERLRREGWRAEAVRDPGSTPLGSEIRRWLDGSEAPSPAAEALLFAAARAELVVRRVRPLLREGVNVVADRFIASTVAYQGHGRGLGEEEVLRANAIATAGLEPDLNVLLDMDPEAALERAASGPGGGGRFEAECVGFHRRVRAAYLDLARRSPARWAVVDAGRAPEAVASDVWERVSRLLAGR